MTIDELRAAMQDEFKSVRAEIKTESESVRAEIKTESENVRTEMRTEFKNVRTEMATEFKNVRTEMATEFKNVRTEMATECKNVRAEIKTDGETTRRHFDIMVEKVNDSVKLVAEATALHQPHIRLEPRTLDEQRAAVGGQAVADRRRAVSQDACVRGDTQLSYRWSDRRCRSPTPPSASGGPLSPIRETLLQLSAADGAGGPVAGAVQLLTKMPFVGRG